ncbi:3-hydroxyacyl-CoA dehydrogenase/enoyl-CoA hydratase/3-hydroxybutyryl-CoA epimerase [Homoserinimonas aerilata]|uniref:3-hydroxyacyl-CoA dehydrogenase/enoyl-CoA hydratase/3-hydroxybutyryl-CoA epimerase n=1 Tax=Homoserinimonas aerilata TaxID=1162970 RepID=A0A542YJP3_9MICO|nr:3-hydroxyacyl-CoA dehydrogenase NAD-binding domain-containing protein [Homoserinimonas aerilata]TQL48307.1 3-hydroxyacyl-CoA dehydrogenase/enoyl-CoA hydratase/3-hydroxybutyryl-CoA epimerase [Homoserinimonas aerilata]
MIRWEQHDDGVVILTMDDPNASINTINETYISSMGHTLDRLEAERDSIAGVVLLSAKKTFSAGADLQMLRDAGPHDAERIHDFISRVKAQFRRLETLGRPVVAAMSGTALGGGLELALATHRRIAVDAPRSRFGLPEVTLGLFPGAGGITRLVRMLGVQRALTDIVLPGTRFGARDALAAGLIDELVADAEALVPAAKQWIASNPSPVKPWDEKGFRLPGGEPASMGATLTAMPAMLRRQLKGAPMPAPRAALAAAVEGSFVDVDTALLVETRYFVSLVIGPVAKNMTGAFFFDMQQIMAGASRPAQVPKWSTSRVGVLGAGMMGAGIAYAAAKAGADVVLRDVTLEAAEHGRAHAAALEQRAIERGRTSPERSAQLMDRIRPTASVDDLADVDIVVEAVFEGVDVKQQVFREVEPVVGPDALLGSNTSTLPITQLAEAVSRPADFIGIHFFSPVHRMPLVEIVRGEQTSDVTLARAFDFVLQLGKTPIVVNDSRGFFTSRVIMRYLTEAVAAVGEGVAPSSVEQAALQAGYPSGPLQLVDELTLTLARTINDRPEHASAVVLDRMIDEFDRRGRSSGAGFYDYVEGRRVGLWPGLRQAFGAVEPPARGRAEAVPVDATAFRDLQHRMLFAEAIESVRCLDEGVLSSVADANVGSLLGIGFPLWTGGVLQFIDQFEGGLPGFVARARELEALFGEQFTPPASLLRRAEAGESFR